jgi:dTMP kinase
MPSPTDHGPAAVPAAALHGQAGLLIAVDGPSGVGKTTVTAQVTTLLAEQGREVLATGQPSDSPMGRLARTSTHRLRGLALSFLMAADRHHHQDHVIVPALAEGRVVVCDRYVPTALVLDQLDGADPGFVLQMYRHMVRPDLAVLLAGDPATCRARAAARGTYSRFHDGGAPAGRREAALYRRAGELLTAIGYPVAVVDTTGRSAQAVAAAVAALIGELRPSSASRLASEGGLG